MRLFPSKRRLKRIGIGLGIIFGVLFIVNGIFALWTERQWQNRLAAIRAAGDPASIADLKPAPIPDDQNAAVYIETLGPKLESFHKAYSAFLDSDAGKDFEEMYDRGVAPTAEQTEAIKAILEDHADVLTAVDAAVATGEYASLLDYSLDYNDFQQEMLDSAPQIRGVARYYDWKMRILVDEGRNEEAALAGIQFLRLVRLYESEPTIFHQLIAIACRGIAIQGIDRALRAGPITADTRAALNSELVLHNDPQSLAQALKTERAFSIDAMVHLTSRVSPTIVRLVGWPVKRYYIGALDFQAAQIELAAEPWHEVHSKIGREGLPQSPTGKGVFADLLLPAVQAFYDAFSRSLAMVRALHISNALTAFRQEQGREAKDLSELSLPKEAIVDPFSGSPMKIKLTEEGWIIYSVFKNGVDDGGDFRQEEDYGLAPPGYSKQRSRE